MSANNDELKIEIDLSTDKFKNESEKIIDYVKKIDKKFKEVNDKVGGLNGILSKAGNGLKNLAGIVGISYGLREAYQWANKIADKQRDTTNSVKKINYLLKQNVPLLDKFSSKSTFSQDDILKGLETYGGGQDYNFILKNLKLIQDYAVNIGSSFESAAEAFKVMVGIDPENISGYRKLIEDLRISDLNKKNSFLSKYSLEEARYKNAYDVGSQEKASKMARELNEKVLNFIKKNTGGLDESIYNENKGYFDAKKEEEKLELSWGPNLLKIQTSALEILAKIYGFVDKASGADTLKNIGILGASLGVHKYFSKELQKLTANGIIRGTLQEGSGAVKWFNIAKFGAKIGGIISGLNILSNLTGELSEGDVPQYKKDEMNFYKSLKGKSEPERKRLIDEYEAKKNNLILDEYYRNNNRQFGGVPKLPEVAGGGTGGTKSTQTILTPQVPQLYGMANQKVLRVEFHANSIHPETIINNYTKDISQLNAQNIDMTFRELFTEIINQTVNNTQL